MTTNSTPISTPLDDLKDLEQRLKDPTLYPAEFCGSPADEDSAEVAMLDAFHDEIVEALAKHIPGMRIDSRTRMPIFETEEAWHSFTHYDDGTPVVEEFSFPDADGISFSYRPRYDGDRAAHIAKMREFADQYKADRHARYTSVGSLGIEYIGEENGDFAVHLGDEAHTTLHRGELLALRVGIDRILDTQTRYLNEQHDEEDECETPE